MEFREVGAGAVFRDEAFISPVIRFPDGGVDADFRGHPRDDQLSDATVLQDGVQVGGVEGSLARLVDHRLQRQRIQFRDDVVPGLAADQDAAHRSSIADCFGAAAPVLFGRREIAQVGPVAFPGVDHGQPGPPPRRQQHPVGFDGATEQGDIIAQHFPEAVRFKEVALHVDDEQGAAFLCQSKGIRFGFDGVEAGFDGGAAVGSVGRSRRRA